MLFFRRQKTEVSTAGRSQGRWVEKMFSGLPKKMFSVYFRKLILSRASKLRNIWAVERGGHFWGLDSFSFFFRTHAEVFGGAHLLPIEICQKISSFWTSDQTFANLTSPIKFFKSLAILKLSFVARGQRIASFWNGIFVPGLRSFEKRKKNRKRKRRKIPPQKKREGDLFSGSIANFLDFYYRLFLLALH